MLAGCEDNSVRIFELNSGKVIKKLETEASVGCVLGWEDTIVVGDHNGGLSNWDSRMFRIIDRHESIHYSKYDNGVTCMGRLGEWLLTSGADGIVKIFR